MSSRKNNGNKGPQCWECGQEGHVRWKCPSVQCRHCGQTGHLARGDCPSSSNQHRPRSQRRGRPIKESSQASNDHRLPRHWALSREVTKGSFTQATAIFQQEKLKCELLPVSKQELLEVKDLVRATWREKMVGKGVDAMDLHHSFIKVLAVERIENPSTYKTYSQRKQVLLKTLKTSAPPVFRKLGNIRGSTGPIWTTENLHPRGILRSNIYPRINEYYLFHGTKPGCVDSIADKGFDMDRSQDRSLLGAGIYFAESSTKSDMYADPRNRRTDGEKHMLLTRVLLGEHYVNRKQENACQRPPCRRCFLKEDCDCRHPEHFDSIVDDSRRRDRVFVVYDPCQCYPEYLITYIRVNHDEDDEDSDGTKEPCHKPTASNTPGSSESAASGRSCYPLVSKPSTTPSRRRLHGASTQAQSGKKAMSAIVPELTSASSVLRPTTTVPASRSAAPSLAASAGNTPTPKPITPINALDKKPVMSGLAIPEMTSASSEHRSSVPASLSTVPYSNSTRLRKRLFHDEPAEDERTQDRHKKRKITLESFDIKPNSGKTTTAHDRSARPKRSCTNKGANSYEQNSRTAEAHTKRELQNSSANSLSLTTVPYRCSTGGRAHRAPRAPRASVGPISHSRTHRRVVIVDSG